MTAVYVFMLARPISVGMTYTNVAETKISTTQTDLMMLSTKKMKVKTTTNSNITGVSTSEVEYWIYSQGGKVSVVGLTSLLTEDAYKKLTDTKEEQDNLIKLATYEFNSFTAKGPMGDYKCNGTLIVAIVGGILELVAIGFMVASLAIKPSKKKRK